MNPYGASCQIDFQVIPSGGLWIRRREAPEAPNAAAAWDLACRGRRSVSRGLTDRMRKSSRLAASHDVKRGSQQVHAPLGGVGEDHHGAEPKNLKRRSWTLKLFGACGRASPGRSAAAPWSSASRGTP